MPAFTIGEVSSEADLAATINLFKAYAQWLGIDLTFQGFASELSSMPGKYAPPTGCLLLARNEAGEAIGCVGLRPLTDGDGDNNNNNNEGDSKVCEMKRLYVNPSGRGLGAGKGLAEAVIAEAKTLGYAALRLDTLPQMESARALYKVLGFVERSGYYETPLEGTIFLELDLSAH